MAESKLGSPPHLDNLHIEGLLGFRKLAIERLGRVTVVAGMNGVGKTTVLDAAQLYASRGSPAVAGAILDRREETIDYVDSDGDMMSGTKWESLFWGRAITPSSVITIGSRDESRQLRLTVEPPDEDDIARFSRLGPHQLGAEWWILLARFQSTTHRNPMIPLSTQRLRIAGRRSLRLADQVSAIGCESLGPGPPDSEQIGALWRNVVLTDAEAHAIEALNIVFSGSAVVERGAVVPGDRFRQTQTLVQIAGADAPVPLQSLGDGAVRTFGVALALANCRNGFLLIDEVENGIHHSVQPAFWKMILKTAQANNTQVIATTHGWDAVVGFARAAAELDTVDGALVRLERDGDDTYAIEYTERELTVIADQGIEVR